MAKIKNMGTATMRFGEGVIVKGNASNPDGTDSGFSLVVSGNVKIAEGADLIFQKGESETSFIQFKNADDGSSYNAYFAYQAAEHIYISPGRGADFYLQQRTNVGGDPYTFPFRVFDDGKVKFEVGQSDGNDSAANLPSDVIFYVSGSNDSSNNAVFGGDLIVSGNMTVADAAMFNLSGSNNIGFDASNEIHVTAGGTLSYKVKTDGNVEFQTAVTSSHFKVEGAGGQFVAFNEDTVKLKHVNWYSSNDRQYGQGQLWYQQWFGAVEPSDSGAQGGRRIGFFFHEPNKGASDADGGTGAHPTNTHMYLDLNGMTLQTGSLDITGGTLSITGSDGNSGAASFEDYIMAELSISGLDLQTDTNAFRFNCPYNLVVEGLDLYLDQHTTSGNVTVTVTNTTDTNNMITLSITGTNTSASTTTVSNSTCGAGDVITFAITATPANAQGLRANMRFRRLI